MKEAVDILSTIADEGRINLMVDGLNTKVVDPAHVAMLDLTLNKKAFEEYKADGNGHVRYLSAPRIENE